ncbi:ABC transporter permease subunit, partial [Delftia acidovorans]
MANEATLNTGGAPRPLPAALLRAARSPWLIAGAALLALCACWAATDSAPPAFVHLWKWLPALLRGLLVNIEISVLAVAIGTVAGLVLGALSLSPTPAVRTGVRWYVQLFRNAPILVLIYFTTYVFPFELKLVGWTFP